MRLALTLLLAIGSHFALQSAPAAKTHDAAGLVTAGPTAIRCQDPHYVAALHRLWEQRKPQYLRWIAGSDVNAYNLYNIQIETNNLLSYAGYCGDTFILDELLSTYLPAINTLHTTDTYQFYYYPGSTARQSTQRLSGLYRMWLTKDDKTGTESILASAQFLYVISEAVSIVGRIPEAKRTTTESLFVRLYLPVLHEHYKRWILDPIGPFQVRGWGCTYNGSYVESGMNHAAYLAKSLQRQLGDGSSPSFCNAVTDADLWILAGAARLLASSGAFQASPAVSAETLRQYARYIEVGTRLLESRITPTVLKDFGGRPVRGALLDAGAWRDHGDFLHAGYESNAFPDTTRVYKKDGVGWDLSHARRFVQVFDALHESVSVSGSTFPTRSTLQELSNQLVYAAFNRDATLPLFSNYMDGTNGWFRVGYSGRSGFGYAPSDMSVAVLEGGYGFWSRYNPDLNDLFGMLESMLKSTSAAARQHVIDHYEKSYLSNYIRVRTADFTNSADPGTQAFLIQFLPSLCDVRPLRQER